MQQGKNTYINGAKTGILLQCCQTFMKKLQAVLEISNFFVQGRGCTCSLSLPSFMGEVLSEERAFYNRGLFINCFTLKLPFFNTPTPHHHASSRMITKAPLHYVTPDTGTPLYHLFLVFEVEKNPQRYAPTHKTSIHVFRQLNQIVRFK